MINLLTYAADNLFGLVPLKIFENNSDQNIWNETKVRPNKKKEIFKSIPCEGQRVHSQMPRDSK